MGNEKKNVCHYPTFAESFSDNAYVLRNTSFGTATHYAGNWKVIPSLTQKLLQH